MVVDDTTEFRIRCREFFAVLPESDDDRWVAGIGFQRRLAAAGLAGIAIPREYGGQGLTTDHEEVLVEESRAHRLPTDVLTITLGMCVPVLLAHGTEAQRRRHVPAMLRGDEIWCQLFSEPNAGSDVAAAQLRAVRDGDEWVLDGQKVWTSSAERSAYGMCIARTDPDVPKHRGLTMFAVPMDTAGITIRPLVQATGELGFNEVFFDGVRLAANAVVGEPGHGWNVAISMLMNERATLGASARSVASGSSAAVLAEAQAVGGLGALDRQVLADLFVREEILRFTGLRIRSATEQGRDPGPVASIAKLAGSDLVRRSAAAHVALRGAGGVAWLADDPVAPGVARALVAAPGLSIAGGTSEIQRTIVGERVLGLPREPEPDRDVAFRDLLQNDPRGGRRG